MTSSTDVLAVNTIRGYAEGGKHGLPLLKVAELPGKGRGFVATQRIPAGAYLHTAEPLAAVVSQEWVQETCAWCFAFSYPKRMRVKSEVKDINFCSEKCKQECQAEDAWQLFVKAMQGLEREFQKRIDTCRYNDDVDDINIAVEPAEASNDDCVFLDEAWTNGVQTLSSLHWVPQNADRTMCRLIAYCLAKKQAGERLVFPDATEFSQVWQIQCNELAHFHRVYQKQDGKIPLEIMDIMLMYIYFAKSVAGILDCPHALFRAIYFREMSNSFGIWENAEVSDVVSDDQELLGWGIYPSAVYFNHSCDANVIKLRKGRSLQFIAKHEISPGQEACISYGSVGEDVKERRQRLKEHYHFFCACTRCKAEDNDDELE